MLKLLRNDDVAADTSLREIQTFCEICDRYGVTPIHAITPIGNVRRIDCKWDNRMIRQMSGTALFSENRAVVEYLRERKSDKFAVHGLWHTHAPESGDIHAAKALINCALESHWAEVFVPPFNEGAYGEYAGHNLLVLGAGLPRIEDYLEAGDPQAEIMYTHSHRYEFGPFTWTALDRCLARLTAKV